jgi:hypothetical protein
LNLAWDTAYKLTLQEEEADMSTWDDNGDVTDQYWDAAQHALRNAITLIQQAHELGLKGKIAAVSPYILIAQDARSWPSASNGTVSFSEFRTIDAVDLPKVFALFGAEALSPDFAELYDTIRTKRNTFSHGVARNQRVAGPDVFRFVLRSFKGLFSAERWPARRLEYLSNDPTAVAYSSDHSHAAVILEMEALVGMLTASEQLQLLGTDKRARWYTCPGPCLREMQTRDEFAVRGDRFVRLAQLSPNEPESTSVYCFVCGIISSVTRRHCMKKDCPSNVIYHDSEENVDICLVCGSEDPNRLLKNYS